MKPPRDHRPDASRNARSDANRFGAPSRPQSNRGPQSGHGTRSNGPNAGPNAPRGGGGQAASPTRLSIKTAPQTESRGDVGQRGDTGPRGDMGQRNGKQRTGGFQGPRRQTETPRHAPDAPKGTVWLYGHHAVAAALANPTRRLRRLLLTEDAEATLSAAFKPPWALAPERADRSRLDHLLGRDVVHQGMALLADTLAPPSLQSVLDKSGPILVLDQITDPRNVGAIMRSATAFGAAAVIVQDRNAPEETGALAKAASGALEKMPLLRAVNIARTIIALKAANVWCIGLDAAGKSLSGPAFADRRIALVLGAEGEGLRRLTRETCDEVAGLAMTGAMESLNVSAAAAIALYELGRH